MSWAACALTISKLSRSALPALLTSRRGIARAGWPLKVARRRRESFQALRRDAVDRGAIDRVSKFVHVAFLDANIKANGAAFLREMF